MAPAFDGSAFRAVRLINPVRTRRWSIGHCAVDWGVRLHLRNRSVGSCVPAARAQAADNGSGLTGLRAAAPCPRSRLLERGIGRLSESKEKRYDVISVAISPPQDR